MNVGPRPLCLAVDGRWPVLRAFCVPGLLCGLDTDGRGKGAVARCGASQGQIILLLDCLAWRTVDGRPKEAARTAARHVLLAVRSAQRDNRPPPMLLRLFSREVWSRLLLSLGFPAAAPGRTPCSIGGYWPEPPSLRPFTKASTLLCSWCCGASGRKETAEPSTTRR